MQGDSGLGELPVGRISRSTRINGEIGIRNFGLGRDSQLGI